MPDLGMSADVTHRDLYYCHYCGSDDRALSAGRRSMDWFGVTLIACVTALGGGSFGCVLLGIIL